MGKVTFTQIQARIFEKFTAEDFSHQFYLTGGTVLSAFYFHHRQSEDLDFFSEKDFDNEPLYEIFSNLSKLLKLPFKYTQRYKARICEFTRGEKVVIKIDVVHHPYSRIEKGITYKNFPIDSLRDIGANKLLCLNQRTDVKDFVDLYFLLKQFTLWDLIYAVEAKFRMKLDILLIAADCMKVEEFNTLPIMNKPLVLSTLKSFFRLQAKTLGRKVTR